ncbi:MAG TPA: hypothetical protein VFQ68_43755 [Streptosporangiaceae bacterium]|nr:hypothetical protein [Streptosporangiaceae bacterium]
MPNPDDAAMLTPNVGQHELLGDGVRSKSPLEQPVYLPDAG